MVDEHSSKNELEKPENILPDQTRNKDSFTTDANALRSDKENFKDNHKTPREKIKTKKADLDSKTSNDNNALLQRSLRLLSAHKAAITDMVEVIFFFFSPFYYQ